MKATSTLLAMAATALGGSEAAAPGPAPPPVPPGHPRVYLRPDDLPALRAKSKDRSARRLWQSVGRHGSDPVVLAFTGLIEQDTSKCAKAVETMGAAIQKTISYHGKPSSKQTTAAGRTFLSVQHEGAVVLDWCYDTIDNKTKMVFVDGLKKVANMDAPGFPINWGPPPHWDTVVGHPCEGWIMTGQLPSGLAMHDIDPSMYEGAARYFFEGLLPVRQLAYPAHKHYEGSHYTYARYEHEIASAMIWNAIGQHDVFPSSQPAVMSDYIYSLLPNGTMVAYGDCEVSRGETLQDEKAMCLSMASALYAGRTPPDGETVLPEHLRWVVDHPPVPGSKGPGDWGSDYRSGLVSVLNFIHIESDTPNSTDIATLPTSRYFPDPMGEMVVRTGWDLKATSTDTIVALRIGGLFFGNHQRRDAGSFQIFYRSALAMSSGHYGSYGTSHWKNYYHSSISVNSLLILDPTEGTENVNGNAGVNIGGQRMPIYDQPKDLATLMAPENKYRVGRVVAQGWEKVTAPSVPRWNWLSGDITDAYCSNKTKHVSRSYLVWVWPGDTTTAAVIIFDRVHSTDPGFKKTFLMHTLNKPGLKTTSAAAPSFDIVAGEGALSGTMLLPANFSFQIIGGAGHEFEAGGQNWPPAKESDGVSGQWRLEVSPKTSQEDDSFLSVWQPHDASGPAPVAPSALNWPGGAVVGVQVRQRIVVFVAAASGLRNVTSLDLRGGQGIVWSDGADGGKTVLLHACGLQAGTWAGGGKTLGQASSPSFCLVANVTKSTLEAGPLHVNAVA